LTFIDELPKQTGFAQTLDRVSLLSRPVITLCGIKRLESEALFVSSEGGGTLRETAKVEFAGGERYWCIARKINGIVRRVLLADLKPDKCTVDVPCAGCEVCHFLGALNTDTNVAKLSRLRLQDLISVQEYVYDEKFRVRLPDDQNQQDPTPFQEVVAPPGTEFPFIVRIIDPSQRDLNLFLYANAMSDSVGYGNYTKLRGQAATDWIFAAEGMVHLSVHRLLTTQRKESVSVAEQMQSFAQSLPDSKTAHGEPWQSTVKRLSSDLKGQED
jgi:hypothetical protein